VEEGGLGRHTLSRALQEGSFRLSSLPAERSRFSAGPIEDRE
jgi:hypothetical protein